MRKHYDKHFNYLVKVFFASQMQVAYLLNSGYQPFYFHIVFGLTGIPMCWTSTTKRVKKKLQYTL